MKTSAKLLPVCGTKRLYAVLIGGNTGPRDRAKRGERVGKRKRVPLGDKTPKRRSCRSVSDLGRLRPVSIRVILWRLPRSSTRLRLRRAPIEPRSSSTADSFEGSCAGRRQCHPGHIPTAVRRLDHDLSGPKTGLNGRHPLPEAETLRATLGRLRIVTSTGVRDQDAGMYASRLWWLLRWMGHKRLPSSTAASQMDPGRASDEAATNRGAAGFSGQVHWHDRQTQTTWRGRWPRRLAITCARARAFRGESSRRSRRRAFRCHQSLLQPESRGGRRLHRPPDQLTRALGRHRADADARACVIAVPSVRGQNCSRSALPRAAQREVVSGSWAVVGDLRDR